MKAQGGGQIVNVSSTAGRAVGANIGVYSATKWSVNAFSEALRQEVSKDKIRVTIIEPGPVATEINEHISNLRVKNEMKAQLAAMKILNSEDIAAAILYALTQPPHVTINELLILPTEMTAVV